jgi:hypothetical protein
MPKSSNGRECTRLYQELVRLLETNWCSYWRYAALTGSVVNGGAVYGKSDIDLLIVTQASVLSTTDHSHLAKVTATFCDLQRSFGFVPDELFPIEVYTEAEVHEAYCGRGFSLVDGRLELPDARTEFFLKDRAFWYRALLGHCATGCYLFGSKEEFQRTKRRTWDTLICYVAAQQRKEFDLVDISRSILAKRGKRDGLGVPESQSSLLWREIEHIGDALRRQVATGRVSRHGPSYRSEAPSAIWANKVVRKHIEHRWVAKPSVGLDEWDSILAACGFETRLSSHMSSWEVIR